MRLALRSALVTAVAATVCLSPALEAQRRLGPFPTGPLAPERIMEWARAAWSHEPGVPDAHCVAVAQWLPGELYQLFAELRALSGFQRNSLVSGQSRDGRNYPGPRNQTRIAFLVGLKAHTPDEVNRLLKRAAVLHTDINVLMPSFVVGISNVPSPFSGRLTFVAQDGRQVASSYPALHLEFASWLLDGVKPNPAEDPHVRRWYGAAAAWLQEQHRLGDTDWLLSRAERMFSDDALLHFYRGTLDEAFASSRVRHAMQSTTIVSFYTSSEDALLERATARLRQAVSIDPDFAEARLHLGRVLGQLGKHAEAVEEISRAASDLTDPVLQYYAALFLGHEQALTGEPDAARLSFARAHELYPAAQSPLLAMSAVSRRLGDSAGAQAALKQLLDLSPEPDARTDPWWWYQTAHVRDAGARVHAWRTVTNTETAR